MSEKSKEIAVVPVGMGERGIALHNIDEAWRFCKAIEQSGVAPKGMNDAAKIFAVVQAGAELGLTPFRALSNMKIINGRVGPMGALAKALIRREKVLAKGTGFKQDFVGEEGSDDFAARIVTLRAGESREYVTTFSVKDAKLAGLWGKKSRDGTPSPWIKYPKRMLTWRSVGFHIDDYYSDVIMGMHIAEVLGDYPDERIAAVMEPQKDAVKDPLLEELAATAATMQPPDGPDVEGTGPELKKWDGPKTAHGGNPMSDPHPIITDPIEVEGEKVDPATGEYENQISTLDDVMAHQIATEEVPAQQSEMTEEEARADLVREGAIKEEDLAPADPGNAAAEGAESEELF
jgi:hypothetical protein